MSNIYTEEHKLYDSITEAALINLHGLALRNNNEIYLGYFSNDDYAMKFWVEVANMLTIINPDITVYVNKITRLEYIIFKLKNRHLTGIKFTKRIEPTAELYDIIRFMNQEFPEVKGDMFGKIYKTNYERKRK